MTPVQWMIAGSLGAGLGMALVSGPALRPELAGGLAGPLVASVAGWTAVERTFRRNPARVTAVMQAAFLAKAVFFVAYVGVMLRVLALRPGPFVAVFATAFLALYAAQAVLLHRLFAGGARPSL